MGAADYHFSSNVHSLADERRARSDAPGQTGFAFTPASDRQLRVFADAGEYHPSRNGVRHRAPGRGHARANREW